MTHPLDLHPLHQITSEAWDEVRKEHQPVYLELPMAVKSKLLETAARVESGDPEVVFECRIAEKLAAKAEADAKAGTLEEVEAARLERAERRAEAQPAEDETSFTSDQGFEQVADTDEPEVPTTQEEKDFLDLKGPLPKDFPAHDLLHAAAINTYTQLNKVEDLTKIDGVGPATVKQIKKRLKADSKALNG